jgi:hypothetical protein
MEMSQTFHAPARENRREWLSEHGSRECKVRLVNTKAWKFHKSAHKI